ncbi:MAG: hypothetical protein HY677_03550 [Chloroflexi bacterium]|nr:hypothetical protein [Chloroflexota bacterium]
MSSITDQIRTVAVDLVNLEINTIIKPNITGGKMPDPRHALIDIGKDYCFKLRDLNVDTGGLDLERLGSYAAFDGFRKLTKTEISRLTEAGATLTPTQEAGLYMLYRIRDMSGQINGVFEDLRSRHEEKWDNDCTREEIQNLPQLRLTPHQIALIRKVWEIGVEEIAMQTVIQLDGDVITRIQPEYAHGGHEALLAMHREAVITSVDFWKELIGIATSLLQSLFRLISPIR